jgi:aldose 1-epimerase
MLTLQAGESSLVLAPEIGGAIVGWTIGATPLLRRPAPDAIIQRDAGGLACFPLVPFSNRIAQGKFRWGGHDYTLARNHGDRPHPIHGVGWQSAWTVAAASATSAVLTLMHNATGAEAARWPFAFEAEQRFTLTTDGLHIALSLTNRHAEPAPAGFGLHPYFARAHDATLRFGAREVWTNLAEPLPRQHIPVPPEWDHARGLRVGSAALDHCFTGWDGSAGIAWASGGPSLVIGASDLFRHLIIYTPPGQDFFCVEPVSHMTDAINRMDGDDHTGLRVLAPGATLQGEITFRLATSG